jgi:hypothetical protein
MSRQIEENKLLSDQLILKKRQLLRHEVQEEEKSQ